MHWFAFFFFFFFFFFFLFVCLFVCLAWLFAELFVNVSCFFNTPSVAFLVSFFFFLALPPSLTLYPLLLSFFFLYLLPLISLFLCIYSFFLITCGRNFVLRFFFCLLKSFSKERSSNPVEVREV